MCSKDPKIPARSILELSRMLHSHRPLFRAPSTVPPSVPSSFLLPLHLSFQVVNMPHPVSSGFIPRKGNRRLLQTLHRQGGTDHRERPFSFALTDLGVARFLVLSLPPSFYAPQDLRYGLRNQGLSEKPKVVDE